MGASHRVHHDWKALYAEGGDALPREIGGPQPALAALVEREPLGQRVLDAGCGTGALARLLASRGHDVVGIDVSPEAVRIARRSADEASVQARFVAGDARDLPRFVPGPFDVAVDSGLLHSFDDDDQVRYLDALHAVCADGAGVHVLCMAAESDVGWGLTRGRLESLFAEPAWAGTRIEPAELHARIAGSDVTLPGHLVSTVRRA